MEDIRQRKDLRPQPVGRPSQPRKGAVGEDLGRTEFKYGPSRKALNPLPKPNVAHLPESDDDLDAFSSKNKSSLCSPQLYKDIALQQAAPTSIKKGRQVSRATESLDVDESDPRHLLTRPRPRPAIKKAVSDKEMRLSDPLSPNLRRTRKGSSAEDGQGTSPREELSQKRLKTSVPKVTKTEPAPFPMEVEPAVNHKRSSPSCSPPKPGPFPIAVPSPKTSYETRKPAPFPMDPSPQQLEGSYNATGLHPFPMTAMSCSKEDDDVDSKINENDVLPTYDGPRPFPMSIFQFQMEPTPIIDKEDSETSPRSRNSSEHIDFGELSLDDADVDPSTICPYCDEPWPPAPSQILVALLQRTKRKSYADPRHGNALGLKAPFAVFVELCLRHRFEMTHLPLALARGWPTQIDFAGLPKRIRRLRKHVKSLLDQPEKSNFWRDVRDAAREVGTSKIVSVTGQYATFERSQPGYYGEQGSIIIHQSLYSFFPPDSIPTTSVLPLTPDQFLTRVLVPEVAVLLIQQDMGLSTRGEAMTVLDESKEYGIAMFPEKAQDKDVEEVGEQLARERAKARKKLLEERGEADADVRREVEQEKRQVRKINATEKDNLKAQRIYRGKGTAEESYRDTELSREKAKAEAKECSEASVTDLGRRRFHKDSGVRVKDAAEEPIPCPVKGYRNSRGAPTVSWRFQRSSSTSPVHIAAKVTPSAFHDASSSPPLSSQPVKPAAACSEWVFKMQADESALDLEDDKMVETSKKKPMMSEAEDSDSDVRVITDTETPRQRDKPVRKTNNMHEYEDGTDAQLKVKASGALGGTKRRKKWKAAAPARARQRNGHSWLLSDSSL